MQTPSRESSKKRMKTYFNDERDWFFRHRFGLFIHWGLYALDAWQEQDIWRRNRDRAEYAALQQRFNPKHFDPEAWLDGAEAAGMSYLCFTTKHIDGFCLWDSEATDFKITRTPYGKDVLEMIAAACQKRGFPLCLYHSIVDIHHPAYPHAGKRWEFAQSPPGDSPDKDRYLDYLNRQVEELCTRYGKIHGFWWDGNPQRWRDPSINQRIRELQPGIVINNRGFDEGDFGTPERDWDSAVDERMAFEHPVEACQSLGSQSWGYREGEDYYTDKHLIRSIAKVRAKGGNYLLNTGPGADGRIAGEDRRILGQIGEWMCACGEALEDVIPCSELTANQDVVLTRRGNTLYVILHREPVTRSVPLKPLDSLPRSAVLLNDNRAVDCHLDLLPWDHREGVPYLRIHNLPQDTLNNTVPVIRVEFDEDFARMPVGINTEER